MCCPVDEKSQIPGRSNSTQPALPMTKGRPAPYHATSYRAWARPHCLPPSTVLTAPLSVATCNATRHQSSSASYSFLTPSTPECRPSRSFHFLPHNYVQLTSTRGCVHGSNRHHLQIIHNTFSLQPRPHARGSIGRPKLLRPSWSGVAAIAACLPLPSVSDLQPLALASSLSTTSTPNPVTLTA